MDYLEITNEKYGSDELTQIAAGGLSGLGIGIGSYRTIDINTKRNSIIIDFESKEDAEVVRVISGSVQQSNSKIFQSDDVTQFILELYGVIATGSNPD